MNSIASINSAAVGNASTSTNSAPATLERMAAGPQPAVSAREFRTQTLALQQRNRNAAPAADKLDAASLARLKPRELVDRLQKNGLIEIDTEGNQAIRKKLVNDLVDMAATPIGRQVLLGALKNSKGGAHLTPFSIRVTADSFRSAYFNVVTLGTKLFAEDCHLVGDTVSSARSIFVLFHEMVHINQNKSPSNMTYDKMEDDATARTDVFTAQFNAANGTHYPKRITYGETTKSICPVLTSKQVATPEQFRIKIEELKLQSKSSRVTQREFVAGTFDKIIRQMEDLVRIEFGSDTLRAPGGTGRRKQALDSLLLLRSAAAQMRNDKPVISAQLGTLLQTYKQAYKAFFDAMSIDNLPSLPRRRDGGVVKQ